MAKVNVGIVGTGVMGGFHAKIAAFLKESRLIGIFDPDQARASAVALSYGSTAFSSLDELISKTEALVIACPTSLHFEVAKKCLEAGKHLLVEKPLTDNHVSAEELVVLANNQNLVLAVGMIERFNPAFTKAFSIVKNEKILGIDIKRYSPYPERISDVSVVWDVMIHDLDLALLLGKSPLESFKCTGKKIKSIRFDEVEAILYFKDGMICKISCSRAKNEKFRHIQITGEKAVYDVDLLNKKLYRRAFETLSTREEIELVLGDQLSLEQRDFYLSITNKKPPRCPGDQAVVVLKLAEEVEAKCSGL